MSNIITIIVAVVMFIVGKAFGYRSIQNKFEELMNNCNTNTIRFSTDAKGKINGWCSTKEDEERKILNDWLDTNEDEIEFDCNGSHYHYTRDREMESKNCGIYVKSIA